MAEEITFEGKIREDIVYERNDSFLKGVAGAAVFGFVEKNCLKFAG